MSFTRMLEENSYDFEAEQRNYNDGERISLSMLRRLEEKIDDMKLAFQGKIEKLELAVSELLAIMKSNSEHNMHKSWQRCFNLQLIDKIPSPIRTGDEVKGVGGDYIKVSLVDEMGKLVDSGPESSAEVRIFAIEGDSDDNEGDSGENGYFADDTAKDRKTKKSSILVGDLQLKLNKGIGILSNIKFRSSSGHTSGVFKIGARVVDHFDGIVIKDAKTVSFRVRDYRGKYNEKHHPPFVSDEVWRLDNIGKGGKIHKRLEKKNFNTVEDFLIQLLKDTEKFKQLVDLQPKKWEATVKHALTCQLDEKVYCSISSEENKGIVFNAVGKILGLIVQSKYLPLDKVSEEGKVNASKLDVAAFVHKVGGLVRFADEASLLQKFPETVDALQTSNYRRSLSTIDHEDEVSEIGESPQMNLYTSSVDVPSSCHPIEVSASKLDAASFVHKMGGVVRFADEASLLQQFPEPVNASHPSDCTISQNTIDHEDEISEIGEFHQTNLHISSLDVPPSSHPIEVNASMLDFAAFVHKGGLVPSADEASEPVNALHHSNCTRSKNAVDHEDEISEIGESLEMNVDTLFKDVPSSSHPLEIDQYLGQQFIDTLFDACDNYQNSSFTEMMRGSPTISNIEVKKKLFFLFTVTKWFLNLEKMAACDGNENCKRRRIS